MADVLLDRSHQLPGTGRVRLRLARPSDRQRLHGLLEDLGVEAEDIDALRLLRCAPGRCLTVVAMAWQDARERLVGVGSLDFGSDGATLLAPDPAVTELLDAALRDHAQAWARRVA